MLEIEYIAGFVDGEGCLAINYNGHSSIEELFYLKMKMMNKRGV